MGAVHYCVVCLLAVAFLDVPRCPCQFRTNAGLSHRYGRVAGIGLLGLAPAPLKAIRRLKCLAMLAPRSISSGGNYHFQISFSECFDCQAWKMLQKLFRRGIDIDGLVVRELFIQVQAYGSFNVGHDGLHQRGALSRQFHAARQKTILSKIPPSKRSKILKPSEDSPLCLFSGLFLRFTSAVRYAVVNPEPPGVAEVSSRLE